MRPVQKTSIPLLDLVAPVAAPAPGVDPSVLGGVTITGVAMASTEVEPGDLYLGVPGARFHGAAFAADAQRRGALAIVTDAAGAAVIDAAVTLPVFISSESPRNFAGTLASRVYRTDDIHALTLGITGTNGKTSTAHFLDAVLGQLGLVTGLSSTAIRRIGTQVEISHLTTPEAPEVHALLARMIESGIDAAIIEVSAHALTRKRIEGVNFDIVGFTNLSHDHLDDYDTMDDYLAAKEELFQPHYARRGVVCLDTPAGATVVKNAGIPVATIHTVGVAEDAPDTDWTVTVETESPRFTQFLLEHEVHGSVRTRIPMIGAHMASNAGLAIAMLVEAGIALTSIAAVLDADGQINAELPGRLVRVSGDTGPTLYVDSGHTPDAFAKTLAAVRAVTPGRVIMVTGADGGRDHTKRADMGAEAAAGSDLLIITDHHSRTEDPGEIRAALIAGARTRVTADRIVEVANPATAIAEAVSRAGASDTILWCGLASQDYRDVGGVERPFSVVEASVAALKKYGWGV